MDELINVMLLTGHEDYVEFCDEVMTAFCMVSEKEASILPSTASYIFINRLRLYTVVILILIFKLSPTFWTFPRHLFIFSNAFPFASSSISLSS